MGCETSVCAEYFSGGAGYELIPGGRISLFPWVGHIQKNMRPWFVSNLFFFGAWGELIPGGRISSYPWVVHIQKIMRPWFVSNLLLLGAGYELIPGGRINSYPWVGPLDVQTWTREHGYEGRVGVECRDRNT